MSLKELIYHSLQSNYDWNIICLWPYVYPVALEIASITYTLLQVASGRLCASIRLHVPLMLLWIRLWSLLCFFSAPLSTSQCTNRSMYWSLYRKISLRVCFSTSAVPDGIRCVSQNQSTRRARVPDSRLLENSSGCARLIDDDDDDCALSKTKRKKMAKS